MSTLRAPFPFFGGKSRIAALVWRRLGNVANYCEPFLGSGAVLLARPHPPRIETGNDADGMISNFWRAIAFAPEQVAVWADWPVNECDLHARHRWLVTEGRERVERLMSDPYYFDAQVAGWWVWGISQWIGSGWCSLLKQQVPHKCGTGRGVHKKRPIAAGERAGNGVDAVPRVQLPVLSCNGSGGHRSRQVPIIGGVVPGSGVQRLPQQLPHVDGYGGKGVPGISLKRPHLSDAGCGVAAPSPWQTRPVADGVTPGIGVHADAAQGNHLTAWFDALSARLRRVRVCCGDWSRVMGPSVLRANGPTGIFLDPPYGHGERDTGLYAEDHDVTAAVGEWCRANGRNPQYRIALCGYDGEYDLPGWTCVAWKASGGYGNQDGENANAARERVWFSPACLNTQADLFADAPEEAT